MFKRNIENKTIFKKSVDSVILNVQESNKLHRCAFNWTNSCIYCQLGYDELKKQLLHLNDIPDNVSSVLKEKVEACLAHLNGSNKLSL